MRLKKGSVYGSVVEIDSKKLFNKISKFIGKISENVEKLIICELVVKKTQQLQFLLHHKPVMNYFE